MRKVRPLRAADDFVMTKPRQPDEITTSSVFRVNPVPQLDLVVDMSLPLRVYVLAAHGKHYVGIAPAHKIKTRILEQFNEKDQKDSSHFCAKNPPTAVLCVWPARHESAEAYLYFLMMQAVKCTDFRKLGGFVFTSSAPSPLVVMQLEQCRRQLEDRCFTCGQGHHAKNSKCPGPNCDCFYKCNNCKSVINISSRGGTQVYATASAAIAQASGSMAASSSSSAASSHTLPRGRTPLQTTDASAVARGSGTTLAKQSTSAAVSLSASTRHDTVIANARPSGTAGPRVDSSNAAPSRKRGARQAFQRNKSTSSFNECWSRCRKQGKYGCVKDLLREMDTAQAGRSFKHIDENLPRWSKKYSWKAHMFKMGLNAFSGHQGGASAGAGCTEDAMTDVFNHNNKA